MCSDRSQSQAGCRSRASPGRGHLSYHPGLDVLLVMPAVCEPLSKGNDLLLSGMTSYGGAVTLT